MIEKSNRPEEANEEWNGKFCLKNCGFYGSKQFEGYCSSCWHQLHPELFPITKHTTKSYTTLNDRLSSTLKKINSANDIVPLDLNTPFKFKTSTTYRILKSFHKTPATCTLRTVSIKSTGPTYHITSNPKSAPIVPTVINVIPNANDGTTREVSTVQLDVKNILDNINKTFNNNMDLDVIINTSDGIASSSGNAAKLSLEDEFISNGLDVKANGHNKTEKSGCNKCKTNDISGKRKRSKKGDKNRCMFCPRSIQLIGFDCRCGGRYCIMHRLAKEHNCTFNYRAHGMVELAKNNPKIVGDKIKKI